MVEIEFTGKNFSAYVPELPGCVSTGDTPEKMKKNIQEAIALHVKGSIQDKDPIPAKFKGNYELAFKFDTKGLLNYFKGIISAPAFERLTGINQKQILHYASGLSTPRRAQVKKIEKALHQLGHELIAIEL